MVVLALLGGCKDEPRPTLPPASDNGGDTSTPSGDNNNGGTDNYPTSETEVYLTAGGSTAYKLYSTLDKSYTERFQTAFKNKTGVDIELASDMSSDRLIILATGDKFASVEGSKIVPSYTSCQVEVVGEKVCIGIAESTTYLRHMDKLFPQATSMLFSNMTKTTGDWVLSKSVSKMYDYVGVSSVVPVHKKTTAQSTQGFHESTNDGKKIYQVSYVGATKSTDSIDAYSAQLKALGYTLRDDNAINGNKFATYTNTESNMTVHLNWFASKGIFRIIYGQVEYLPAVKALAAGTDYTATKASTMSMLQLDPGDPGGLSLVAQAEDGSFIVVDGGVKKTIHKTRLWNFLNTNKPAGDAKPRVTWVITHAHGDHMANAIDFLGTYNTAIDLQLVMYNFPDFSGKTAYFTSDGGAYYAGEFNKVLAEKYPNTPVYVPHAGEQLYFPGIEMEIYYTQEEMYKVGVKDLNDTCLVFKLKFGSGSNAKTCMVFGDSTNTSSKFGYQLYGNALKSDIMQVPHHGAGTATWELYAAVDPSICLWSVESAKFYDDGDKGHRTGCCELSKTKYEYNWKLRNTAGIDHYHHSQIVTVNMTTLSVSTKPVA